MKMTEGMKSSEFLVVLFAFVLILLDKTLGITPDQIQNLVITAVGYAGARGLSKMAVGRGSP